MTASTDRPLVTVVVAAYNAAGTIGKCLDSLASVTWPADRLEVIVVDDGSTDDTRRLAASRAGVRTLDQPNAGPSCARNLGLAVASGDLVAFTDSDCIVAGDWVERLAGHFRDESVMGAGGSQRCPSDATPFMEDVHGVLSGMGFLGGYTKSAATVGETGHNPSCNVMYRRAQVAEVGGFRPGMFPGEDVDLDHRLRARWPNGRLLYDPSASVFHYRPTTFGGWWRMMRRYGYSSGHNVRLHGYFRALHAVPWLMAATAGLWLLLLGVDPRGGTVAGLAAGLGVLAFAGVWCGATVPVRTLRRACLVALMLAAFPLGYFDAWRSEGSGRAAEGPVA
jgi:glycosyltransferase involved in cell wall biosynthesis